MEELLPSEVLCIPKRRRLTHTRFKNDEGQDVLHLFYGPVELIFDEPDLAPVGEKLLELERFRADEARSWSNAAPHEWEKIRELLQALIDQHVLQRYSEVPADINATFPLRLGLAPEDREPRTFSAHDTRCPAITEEAFGRGFEISNLEVLVPIYRVAHPAMDTDGRQVGENNVTPRTLFLDLPTQRRVCNYPGSRFQDELPMNITALKLMAKSWPTLLSLTEQFRVALFERLPPRDPAALRAGELHFLAVCMLASVGYVMVRGKDPSPNGQLDNGLSAIFRLVDGVRLVTTDMLHASTEGAGCHTPVGAQIIADYADHYSVYRGNHGVCSGPPALIDEYLRVLTGEAQAPIQAAPSLAERLGDLEAAIDYGLLGQRIECAVRFLGASQGLLQQRLRQAYTDAGITGALRERLDTPIDTEHYPLLRDTHPLLETYQVEQGSSRWLFGRAAEGLAGKIEVAELDEALRIAPAAQADSARRLADWLALAVADKLPAAPLTAELAAIAAEGFALERRVLRLVGRELGKLNERLQRPPGRALTGMDLAVYNRPRFGPPLYETLAGGLGLTIDTSAEATVLRHGDHSLTLTD